MRSEKSAQDNITRGLQTNPNITDFSRATQQKEFYQASHQEKNNLQYTEILEWLSKLDGFPLESCDRARLRAIEVTAQSVMTTLLWVGNLFLRRDCWWDQISNLKSEPNEIRQKKHYFPATIRRDLNGNMHQKVQELDRVLYDYDTES